MSMRNKLFSFVFSLMAVAFVLTGCGTSAEKENTAKESGEKKQIIHQL